MEKFWRKVASLLHRIACKAVETEAKVMLHKGRDHVFLNKIMAPEFDYKPHLKRINPYFAQWGFKFNMVEAEYFSKMSGVKSDTYISGTLFFHYLMPYFGSREKYRDKNLFRKFLDDKSTHKKVDFRMPYQVAYNIAGRFYNGDDESMSLEEAVEAVMAYPGDIIAKPTLKTTWGKGVAKLRADEKNPEMVREMFAKYKKNFSFEECIAQHEDLASLNASSLNTTRVVTYRRPNGQLKFLFAIQRFGKEGRVIDNASVGGNFVGVYADGTLDRTIKQFATLKTRTLSDKAMKKVPFFDRIIEAALYLHSKIPDQDYIGWDFSVTQEGQPIVIEFNCYASTDLYQIAIGPAFSKEDLDELMPLVATWKATYDCIPKVAFEAKKGHKGTLYI